MITAVVITKNEERNIARCLDSLRGLVDEIIVIDSFSTDTTPEICEQYKVEFVQAEWRGYSKTKNFGNKMAKGDYILSIDADEAISPELKKSIEAAKADGLNGCYSFNRLTNYCGEWIRYSGWYPDTKVRLFPKEGSKWKGDFVHEEITLPEGAPITHLQGDLHHYSYYTVEEHEERLERYAMLGAKKVAEKKPGGLWLKYAFSPLVRFIKMYIFQQGFRDKFGYTIAKLTSREVRIKYSEALRILGK